MLVTANTIRSCGHLRTRQLGAEMLFALLLNGQRVATKTLDAADKNDHNV
jgi:hypothetical protein